MKTDGKPVLCFIGPLVGRRSGNVTTQGEILSDQFASSGYAVIEASSRPGRIGRLLEILWTILSGTGRIDVLMLQTYGGRSFVVEDLASAAARLLGQRVIMTLRGGAMGEFMRRFPRWSRRVLRRADAIVVPSGFLEAIVQPHGFAPRVIPNVIALERYPYRKRSAVRPALLWVRTFQSVWNPEMAVRVLARLRKLYPAATLTMAGEDKYGRRTDVEELAVSLGVADAVRFVGFLDMEGKVREGSEADIFLNTNRIDNMPVTVIEACAMGLAVVSTNVGGIPYLLDHGETALLVPDDDDAAMAAAVERLLHEPDLVRRLSENARRLAEQSAWNNVLPRWERVFREAGVVASGRRA